MALVNVYIRKMGADGGGNARPTYNIREHFGFVIQELPFDLSTDVKDVDTVDYFDEDGSNEWMPAHLRIKSYDMKVKFISKGTKEELYTRYSRLRNYLLGRDNTGVAFMIYDEYHGIGRKDIRLQKLDDEAEYEALNDGGYVFSIEATFKVNDPLTEVFYDSATGTIDSEGGTGLIINGEEVVPYEHCYVVGQTLYIV